jgi:hypothetical protein
VTLARLLNENRIAGTLGAACYSVIWFGGWTLLGAAKLVREAACGAAHPDERDAPARGWAPRPSIYRDGYVHS